MTNISDSEYPINHAYAIRQLNVMADKDAHCAKLVTGDHIEKYKTRENNYRAIVKMAQEYVVSTKPMDQEIDQDDHYAIDEMIYSVIQATHAWARKLNKDPVILEQHSLLAYILYKYIQKQNWNYFYET